MERPVISFIKGANIRPKADIRIKPRNLRLDKPWTYAHNDYSDVKVEDLPSSEIGDGSIFIEEL